MTDRAAAALLAVCANPDADHAHHLALLAEDEWQELVELAGEQRAVPLVARAVERAGDALRIPHSTRHALRQWQLLHTRALLAQRQALAAALAVLSASGIEPIVLKGAALAYRDYPDPALRPMRDFDLLVPAGHAERAQSSLLASGRFELLGEAPYGIEYGHQLPELIDRKTDTVFEIHHRLNARGWAQEPRLVERMYTSAAPLDFGHGLGARVPHPHDNVLHLAEHATLHHLFDNGPLVLADLHYAAGGGRIEWPLLLAEADTLGLRRALELVAAVALRHGASWPPAALRDAPAPDTDFVMLAEDGLLRTDARRRRLALFRRLELRTGERAGWRSAVRAAIRPGASALAEAAGTRADDPWRWLAYPLWLFGRLRAYADARRSGVAAGEASRQVRLHRWLHGGEGAPNA